MPNERESKTKQRKWSENGAHTHSEYLSHRKKGIERKGWDRRNIDEFRSSWLHRIVIECVFRWFPFFFSFAKMSDSLVRWKRIFFIRSRSIIVKGARANCSRYHHRSYQALKHFRKCGVDAFEKLALHPQLAHSNHVRNISFERLAQQTVVFVSAKQMYTNTEMHIISTPFRV